MDKQTIQENVIALALLVGVLAFASVFSTPADQDPYRGLTHAEIESGIREQLELGPSDTITLVAEEGAYSRWNGQLEGDGGGYILVMSTKGGPEILATGQGELTCEYASTLEIPVALMTTCVAEDGSTVER